MLIAAGCKPNRGRATKELFLSYAQPAVTCPRGTPEHEPNIFDRAYAWLRSGWNSVREWIASHVGREREDRDRRTRDRYLGVPKLPEAREIPAPMIDSTILLDIDTSMLQFEPVQPETLYIDTLPTDTIDVDTLPRDTFAPLPPDTMPPDTLAPATSGN
jgi:hypothetical protein